MFQSVLKGDATSSNRLIIGDPKGHVAVVTLWSKLKEMEGKVRKEDFCVMGQLFSAERGLDLLMRNLLANPQITNIVVTGVDFSKSGIVLEDFFRNGFEPGQTRLTKKPVWKVRSRFEGYIDMDIPEQALQELRETVNIARVGDISALDFSLLERPVLGREGRIYPKIEEEVKKYIGEYTGHLVRGKTVAEAWLKALDTILKFGKESETHYSERQREILNMLSVIEEEDPADFFIPDYLPCDRERVRAYIPRITRDLPGGIHRNEYTYGSRMRSWFGTDQVQRAVQKLAREPVSRAVVIGLWDSTRDLEIGGSPCLNHIWLRVSEDKLHMTAIFRSHDMFEGYPENLFGLRVLQDEIRKELAESLGQEVGLGELMVLSQSAHLYADTWEWAEKVIEEHLPKFRRHLSRFDPRGNLLVSVQNGEIVLEHTGPGGEKIGEFRARTGAEMRDILVKENVVSLVAHGIDLGLEIMKAEVSGKLGIGYEQDRPLDIDKGIEPEKDGKVDQKIEIEGKIEAEIIEQKIEPATPYVRVIKEGIVQPDHQKKAYPKLLENAGIHSIA